MSIVGTLPKKVARSCSINCSTTVGSNRSANTWVPPRAMGPIVLKPQPPM